MESESCESVLVGDGEFVELARFGFLDEFLEAFAVVFEA